MGKKQDDWIWYIVGIIAIIFIFKSGLFKMGVLQAVWGPNLVPDPSFTNGGIGWDLSPEYAVIDDVTYHTSPASLRFDPYDGWRDVILEQSYRDDIKGGDVIKFGGWIMAENGRYTEINVFFYDISWNMFDRATITTMEAYEFTYYELTYTVPSGTEYTQFYIGADASTTDRVWFDDFIWTVEQPSGEPAWGCSNANIDGDYCGSETWVVVDCDGDSVYEAYGQYSYLGTDTKESNFVTDLGNEGKCHQTGTNWEVHIYDTCISCGSTYCYLIFRLDAPAAANADLSCTTCIPDCTGRECGDDGCGGSCGTCSVDYSCVDYQCVQDCVEDWQCTAWGDCIGGTQTRICTDNNNCGTTVNKPIESQSCTVTCYECDTNCNGKIDDEEFPSLVNKWLTQS